MLSLLYKDLRVGLVFLALLVPMFVLGAFGAVGRGQVFFWYCLVFAAAIVFGVSQMDWRHGVDRFVHSLPVSRDLVVRARYAWAVLAGATTLMVAGAAGVMNGSRLAAAGQDWPRWVSADVALAWVLLYVAVVSLYLPCYFRWGHGRGYIIGALAIAAGVVAGGFVQQVIERGAPAAGLPQGVVVTIVVETAVRYGTPLTAVLVVGLSVILLSLSAHVSTRAYRQREF